MILRVHFRRAVKDIVLSNSIISFEIIVGGEFNEPIKSSLVFSDVEVLLLAGVLDTHSNSSAAKIVKFQVTNESIYHLSVNSPQSLGEFFLHISIKGRCDIISTISGRFTVVQFAEQSAIRPLLYCFREIMLPTSISTSVRSIYIQEEYGATLGSHLYDSSIVLLRCIQTTVTIPSDGIVVELGAGCGLLGIFLALLSNPPCRGPRILMTDKQYQLDLLRRNVHLNGAADRCSVAELDWESEAHLLAVRERIGLVSAAKEEELAVAVADTAFVSTIIATDVLYDQSVVEAFCHIVKSLSTPGVTKMFLAQKMRGPATVRADENDRILSVARSIKAVYEEDAVIVWIVHM